MNSSSFFAPNIFTVAGFPEVNLQEGGSKVIRASRELSKRSRYFPLLSAPTAGDNFLGDSSSYI
jgi:hypothetical protein